MNFTYWHPRKEENAPILDGCGHTCADITNYGQNPPRWT